MVIDLSFNNFRIVIYRLEPIEYIIKITFLEYNIMQTTIQFPTRKRTAGRQTVKRNLSLVDIENSPVKRPRTEGNNLKLF